MMLRIFILILMLITIIFLIFCLIFIVLGIMCEIIDLFTYGWKLYFHNRRNNKNKLIKCKGCGCIQREIDWDHQRCIKCDYMIYDYRN